MKEQKNPGWGAGAGNAAPYEGRTKVIGRQPAPSFTGCPLRSFKLEHREFSRLVIAPRLHEVSSPRKLQAQRLQAAWRTMAAGSRKSSVSDMLTTANSMSETWARWAYCLPNTPPPFKFDSLDAYRMVLDVVGLRARKV